jgi:toxin HigB-1
MIEHFKDKEVKRLFEGGRSKVPQVLQMRAVLALVELDAAVELEDLKYPPGNRLHQLSGKRKNQHAISLNGNYRLCFSWNNGQPRDVEIIDYH